MYYGIEAVAACWTITALQCFDGVTDTKFKQQKLPAWQPIMTAGTVLPVLFAVGVTFIPLGVALLVTSNNVSVLTVLCIVV